MKIKPIISPTVVKKVAKPVEPKRVSPEVAAEIKELVGEEIFNKYDMSRVLVKRRNVPNWVGTEEDYKDALPSPQSYTDFYPEDKEKMEKMTVSERLDYKAYLIDIGRCFSVQGIKPIPPDMLEKYCK